jgi:tetratricopeptide (TPR) repeat protein
MQQGQQTQLRPSESKLVVLVIVGIILIATVFAFWPLRHNAFVNFDDNEYLTQNPQVRSGLSLDGLVWAFKTKHAGNWHPLTWLSHMTDFHLFGSDPAGHHLMSLAFHTANALLLFLVFKLMTGNFWRSAFIAALFALHPLHVESVVWAAERKDVLSGFFWLLTMLFYVHYVRGKKTGSYILAVLSLALGLMAKPMLVTLPFVLLVLDYWPLSRLQFNRPGKALATALIEKLPFFILAGLSIGITIYAQQSGGAVKGFYMLPLKFRIGNAIVSYITYISKMFWPAHLAVFYPHPGDGLSWSKVAAAGLALVCIFILVIRQAKHRPWLATGWFWYVGTLVPVIGLVQVGAQAMADRYTYLPLTGLFVIIAWMAPQLLSGWRYQKTALEISSLAVLLALAVCTYRQVGHWRDSFTLFRHAIAVTEKNQRAHFNLAHAFAEAGQIDKAAEHYTEAVEIKPGWPDAHHNLAVQLFKLTKLPDAVEHYKKALQSEYNRPLTHNSLGVALEIQGRYEQAEKCYCEAIKLQPDYAKAHYNLAHVLALQGKRDDAIQQYRLTLQIDQDLLRAQQELTSLLKKQAEQTNH